MDAGIIEALQEDGRILYDLAKKMGVSLPTVRARTKRLMYLGVIRKFTVIVDADKIYGKSRTLCLVEARPGSVEKICTKLSSMKEVRETYVTAGSHAVTAKIEVNDISELGRMMTVKLQELPGVSGVSCLVITQTKKEEYGAFAEPDVAIQYRCDFCGGSIVGKPHVEFIRGGRYYFTGKECVEAYKRKLEEQKEARTSPDKLIGPVH